MSTKAVIKLDEDNIYLQVEDLTDCCFELWEDQEGNKSSLVKVKIPIKNWKKIVKSWNALKKRGK